MTTKGLFVTVTTLATLAILGAACSTDNSKTAKGAITSGNESMKSSNYSAAEAYYKVAQQNDTENKKAASYAKAAKSLASADKQMNNYHLATALKQAKSTHNGTSAINAAKKRLVKKITVRQQTIKAFNHEIALAKTAASNGNSASALGTINDLLGDHDIQAKQYYQIQIKALKLKVSLLKGATANTDANESTTGSATTNSNNSSSDNNPSSSISSSTSSSDHDGSDAVSSVTSAEIEQARKDLQSEGVDPSAWSDADIAQAILNAKKDGRTKVKESDMENYQN